MDVSDVALKARLVDVAMRRSPADLVVRGGRIFDLVTGELRMADVAIVGETIAAVGLGYEGKRILDAQGLTVVPGFVDAHCHIESSLVRPYAWEEQVLRHGTVSAVCDPHELANVCGTKALDFFLKSAEGMVMRLQVQAPSCVPALPSEEAGAVLNAEALAPYAKTCALAEMMNVPGVLGKAPDVLSKLVAFGSRPVDGHAPLVPEDGLNALAAVGVASDHECSSVEEALGKLRLGWTVFVRLGSVGKNLKTMTSLFTLTTCDHLCFCTDDADALDLLEHGHLENAVRLAVNAGCDPLAVYRSACLTPARHFGWRGRGLVAPGYAADLALIDGLASCNVRHVVCRGREVGDETFAARPPEPDFTAFLNTVLCRELKAEDFAEPSDEVGIGIEEGTLLTKVVSRKEARGDRATCALIARHGKSDRIGKTWVHGFGLRRGALASTVGHDSHNMCVVGADAESMAIAANALRTSGGGFAVAVDGKVTCLPLPLGGLMSVRSVEETAQGLATLREAAKETGTTLSTPFLVLAFLPLPVIPSARLTLEGFQEVRF